MYTRNWSRWAAKCLLLYLGYLSVQRYVENEIQNKQQNIKQMREIHPRERRLKSLQQMVSNLRSMSSLCSRTLWTTAFC